MISAPKKILTSKSFMAGDRLRSWKFLQRDFCENWESRVHARAREISEFLLNSQIFEDFYIFAKNARQTHFNGKPDWGIFSLGLWGA